MDSMARRASASPRTVHVGIDVGSTTTKVVAIDSKTGDVLFSRYARHGARQAQSVLDALEETAARFPDARMKAAMSGSGGSGIAERLGMPFVQEVVAGAAAVQRLHPQARCAIELGGQDAKMVFFRANEGTGQLEAVDMRMNGSCAGGTGAFLDEMAAVLKIPVEEFDALAAKGSTVYDISGRCGVYAKTDIQPLLNQGAAREDLALSALHAVAKQTLGGLAQGLAVEAPVVFEGGPLTFNPTLVRVFVERLGLADDEAILPEHPETVVAQGAAITLSGMLSGTAPLLDPREAAQALKGFSDEGASALAPAPLFATDAQREGFLARCALPPLPDPDHVAAQARKRGGTLRCYLGIDSGSTTTKLALVDDDGALVHSFYARNDGKPLDVARDALLATRDAFRSRGVELDVVACGTTGYGELLLHRALHADCHAVETVAHARAATRYAPDATFVLDIGGQDMKAIWLKDGVITDIVVNEACSSGCGSFLENLAASLGIPAEGIAEAAFRSRRPASLGSRCTVFMNSSIVSEQRNGRTPDDIVAGLVRSIVENVFTKVVRVANLDSLGQRVVVQGGTFENDAVLRALELHLGRRVTRAPYPGLMGALGTALLAKERAEAAAEAGEGRPYSFIGLDALEAFSYERRANLPCPFCENHCNRTVVEFSDGTSWVTGNRCERGEATGDPKDAKTRSFVRETAKRAAANLFAERERLLLRESPVTPAAPDRGLTVGIPLVLAFWDSLPFWSALFRSIGCKVRVSGPSTRKLYERGLPSVASDTVCFPAKLAHGHVQSLMDAGVDRIFMPIVTTAPTENRAETSVSRCAVVKGYPLVVRTSDDPEGRGGIPFDTPLFHWYTEADRNRQLASYLCERFEVDEKAAQTAIAQADAALAAFRSDLLARGAETIAQTKRSGSWAVVLASRPYHNDPLVNHDLPRMFAEQGIAVLPPDAVPAANEADLSRSRLDIVNNFHARMLGCALACAESPSLELVQLVSFGCGHDAYLSDEIVRLMKERSDKVPLVLKVDESDAAGPLRIRTRSFVETVGMRRERRIASATRELPDPYPAKYVRADRKRKVVLVPNTSHAFCRLMSAAMRKQGIAAEPLEVGREEAIALGKKYVHNDICFPAQMTVGEALAALRSGRYDDAEVAIGTGKYVGDCRLTHYCALLRKALDDAGYAHVPIITNDDADEHRLHPGFKLSLTSSVRIAMALPMIDALEELLRKMRPYELEPGSANRAFDEALDAVAEGLERRGTHGARRGFKRAIDIMAGVRYDRSRPRPRVLIVGEYLLNFHPGANRDIEAYLERNGMEVVEARMTDVIRKTYFYQDAQIREFDVDRPFAQKAQFGMANRLFDAAHDATDRIAAAHPLYEPPCRLPDLARASDPIVHHTFDAGEGILIPAEILHHAARGCRAFAILQPFGCLPNHVVGRGIAGQLRERYPDAQILALDYDPDVSFANIENRLQMLIMNARDAAPGVCGISQRGKGRASGADQEGTAGSPPPRLGRRHDEGGNRGLSPWDDPKRRQAACVGGECHG